MNWVYFLLIGWWLGALWFILGLLLCCTIILWPAGTAMIFQTPKMMLGED